MSEANKRVALAFLEALNAGDATAAAAVLAPDARTVSKGYSKITGERNREQMLAAIGMFRTLMPDGLGPEIHSVTAEGDRVVIEFDGKATLANGAPYHNQYVMLFTLEGGKIRQLHEYFCTRLADEVFFPLVAASGF